AFCSRLRELAVALNNWQPVDPAGPRSGNFGQIRAIPHHPDARCLAMKASARPLIAYTDTVGYLWPTLVIRCVSLLVNILLQYSLVLRGGFGITLWIFGTEYGNFLAGLMGGSGDRRRVGSVPAEPAGLPHPHRHRQRSHRQDRFLPGQPAGREGQLGWWRRSLTFMACIGAFVGTVFYLLRHQLAAYPSIAALRACSYHMHLLFMNFIAYYIHAPRRQSGLRRAGWQLSGLWLGFVLGSFTASSPCRPCTCCGLDWRRRLWTLTPMLRWRTDMELLNERQPLMLAAAATSAATAGNLHPAGASAMASYQLSACRQPAAAKRRPLQAASPGGGCRSADWLAVPPLAAPPRGPTAPAGHQWKRDGLHYSGARCRWSGQPPWRWVRDGHEAVEREVGAPLG
uniref:Rhomboid domain-containing protein n=1 Tax=Macrostomum lignano TaxID=282301 RepID=A0A1I8F9Y0_9PLAT